MDYFVIIILKNGQIIRVRETQGKAEELLEEIDNAILDNSIRIILEDENALTHIIPTQSIGLVTFGKVIEQTGDENGNGTAN